MVRAARASGMTSETPKRRPSGIWVHTGPGPSGVGASGKSSAQITKHYTPATLVGRQVAAVVNFPPRQIGKCMSQVLTLGFPDGDGAVVLFAPDRRVADGARLF